MADGMITCPICSGSAKVTPLPRNHNCESLTGCACGSYRIWHFDRVTGFNAYNPEQRKRITALIRERANKQLPIPLLHFPPRPEDFPELPNTVPVNVDDLLATWPASVAELIDRCFCNLINQAGGEKGLGQPIELLIDRSKDFLFFTDDAREERFLVRALIDYGFVTNDMSHTKAQRLEVTPTGWARYEELRKGAENARNPAFVAMWFGHPNQLDKMKRLFEESIKPGVQAAGYLAMRADTHEHNDFIMGRIVEDIRKSPFVVAELTDDNRGVYYEAGFAHGLGLDVIYCCKEDVEPHFDVSGINQVKWNDPDDLQKKLEHRILGTIGRGPHKFEGTRIVRTD